MSSKSTTILIAISIISISSLGQSKDSLESQTQEIPDSVVNEFLEMVYGKLDPNITDILADSGARDNNKRKFGLWNEYQYKSCVLCPHYEIIYDSIVMHNTESPGNVFFIRERGKYKNGDRQDYWLTYESDRLSSPFEWNFRSKVKYINNKKEGWEHKYLYSKDSVQYEYRKIFYRNGIEEGPVYGFNEKGDTTLIGQFKNGLEHGLFKFRNDTILAFSFDRVYENGEELESIFYHKNGIVATRGLLIDFQPHGLQKNYDENGKLLSEQSYHLGVLEGESRYYSDEKLVMVHNFKDNEMEGLSMYYHLNGQLWSVVEIRNKKLWSVISNFDKYGKSKDKGTLKDGNGSMKRYDENGKLIAIEYYKNGELIKEKSK